MIKPISLRLRRTQALDQAYDTLFQAGRGEELRRRRAAHELQRARETVEKAQEQRRLKRSAVVLAQKAIHAVRLAYAAQEKVADEFDRERWLGLRDFLISELERIVEGRRP